MRADELAELKEILLKYPGIIDTCTKLEKKEIFRLTGLEPGACTLKPMETRKIVLTDGGLN